MPFIWTAVALPVLLLLQRWIHTHLLGIALLLTGKLPRAAVLYALVLLPGVFLHELSHWLTATLLGVRTGGFSLIPRLQKDGSIQLGYVEYFKDRSLGPVRESLIGGAPLLAGTAVILLIGVRIFNVTELTAALQSGRVSLLVDALRQVGQTADLFLWLYLLFAVSNGMMPSRSDRRAWPALLLLLAGLTVLLYVAGFLPALLGNLRQPASAAFGYLGLALGLAIVVNMVSMMILAVLEIIISRLKGVSVSYGRSGAPSRSGGS